MPATRSWPLAGLFLVVAVDGVNFSERRNRLSFRRTTVGFACEGRLEETHPIRPTRSSLHTAVAPIASRGVKTLNHTVKA